MAVFNLNNQRVLGVRAGNAQDLLDLLHGSGLQAQVLKTIGVQLCDQLAGLVQFGNARSDGHGVDGGTGAASLGDNPVDAELEVPHEAVKEHRVETSAATGFEKLLKLQAVLGEDFFGVLSATGHFRPVSSVSCRCDDPRTNGRRGHTGKNDGRATCQAREGGRDDVAAIGKSNNLGSETRPVGFWLIVRTGLIELGATSVRRCVDDLSASSI